VALLKFAHGAIDLAPAKATALICADRALVQTKYTTFASSVGPMVGGGCPVDRGCVTAGAHRHGVMATAQIPALTRCISGKHAPGHGRHSASSAGGNRLLMSLGRSGKGINSFTAPSSGREASLLPSVSTLDRLDVVVVVRSISFGCARRAPPESHQRSAIKQGIGSSEIRTKILRHLRNEQREHSQQSQPST